MENNKKRPGCAEHLYLEYVNKSILNQQKDFFNKTVWNEAWTADEKERERKRIRRLFPKICLHREPLLNVCLPNNYCYCYFCCLPADAATIETSSKGLSWSAVRSLTKSLPWKLFFLLSLQIWVLPKTFFPLIDLAAALMGHHCLRTTNNLNALEYSNSDIKRAVSTPWHGYN